jgi:RNA polymerase sigma factor (sigma-70 family)
MSETREERIARLLPLVRRIARRISLVARGADRDDLLGDGALGLIRAVDTYDPLRGATLEAYARKLIAGAMLNGLRKLDPVSERVRRTLRRAEERRFALAQERCTLPTLAELERGDPALRRRSHGRAPSNAALPRRSAAGRRRRARLDRSHEPSAERCGARGQSPPARGHRLVAGAPAADPGVALWCGNVAPRDRVADACLTAADFAAASGGARPAT